MESESKAKGEKNNNSWGEERERTCDEKNKGRSHVHGGQNIGEKQMRWMQLFVRVCVLFFFNPQLHLVVGRVHVTTSLRQLL